MLNGAYTHTNFVAEETDSQDYSPVVITPQWCHRRPKLRATSHLSALHIHMYSTSCRSCSTILLSCYVPCSEGLHLGVETYMCAVCNPHPFLLLLLKELLVSISLLLNHLLQERDLLQTLGSLKVINLHKVVPTHAHTHTRTRTPHTHRQRNLAPSLTISALAYNRSQMSQGGASAYG